MKTYGLLGYPLSHSFSPGFFAEKFKRERIDAEYRIFETNDLFQFVTDIQDKNISGFNITSPYKEGILPFLDEIEESVAWIGASNCVKVENKKLIGYNTDVYGFRESLTPLLKKHHKQAIILGTGGAAKAVKYVLKELGMFHISVSRFKNRAEITYEQLTKEFIQNYQLIIQATPLGTAPNVEQFPQLPFEALTPQHLCYDLVYNPQETAFLSKCKAQGAAVKNGIEMLHLQAEKSWEIWND